jgi:putative DNA primase/helicase
LADGLGKDEILAKNVSVAEFQAITAPKLKAKIEDGESTDRTHYESNPEEGLVLVTSNQNEDGSFSPSRIAIGNHLEAIAYIDNPERDGAAILLEFGAVRGGLRRWTMPRAELAGDGGEICRGLLGRGYWFDRKQKNHLLRYLQGLGSSISQTYTVTDSSGWVKGSFVLPHKTYGDETLKFRDVEVSQDALTEMAGTLDGWKETVAVRCGGNSRLILALGVAFAAPLLPLLGIESGGFHLVGPTSKGKTTILSVAASVLGLKDIPHWRTTTNGLESTATAFNHLCLPLDEIGQADPKDVGAIAYMLANGQGKARMRKDLTNRKGKTWQLLFLSSGEIGLGDYMAQAGQTQKGGQEVRSPDIPAIPEGSGYGCFEDIHGAADPVQFVNGLEAAVKANHGTAMDAFLTELVIDAANPKMVGSWAKQTHLIAAKLSEGMIDSAIGRVAKRFALVQVALGIAHGYGLLPFPADQIDWAIGLCFKDWVKGRGGDGSIEIKRAIERVEHLLVSNEIGDRVFTLPDNNGLKTRQLLAYRHIGADLQPDELWVYPSIFDAEFVGGVNKAELVKELQKIGALTAPRADGKATVQRRVKTKREYFYVFSKWNGISRNSRESSESGESSPSNLLPEGDTGDEPLTHQQKNPVSQVSQRAPLTHPTHQEKVGREPEIEAEKTLGAKLSASDSPDSRLKQDIPFQEEEKINEDDGEWDE